MYAGRGIQANIAPEYKAGMFFSPIGETELMADDGMGEKKAEFKGMTLMIEVADEAEANRVFTALLINVRCRTDIPSPYTQQSSCRTPGATIHIKEFYDEKVFNRHTVPVHGGTGTAAASRSRKGKESV